MAQTIGKLTALKVQRAKAPGMYSDGGGLYLQVTSESAKSWIFRYQLAGKAREMGLGSLLSMSLADARGLANQCRAQKAAGIDPISARAATQAAAALEAAKALTFDEAARRYIEAHRPGWKNAKHAAQWQSTLDTYIKPVFGGVSVQSVETDLVVKALEPIWTSKPETARRLRGRVESVLDWAKALGLRTGENPARWRGHLEHLLAEQNDEVEHHPALPYQELPTFLEHLAKQSGIAPVALEFTILTCARTNETIGMRFDEIDWTEKVWTVPAERMKAMRPHRVPLSGRALAILRERDRHRTSDYVFPGLRPKKPLSNMAMANAIQRMNAARKMAGLPLYVDPKQNMRPVVPHGFRSSFRDYAGHETAFPREIAEMCLAHVVADETEAAYQRGDFLNKRRRLMAQWEQACVTPVAKRGEVLRLKSTVRR